MPQEIFLLDESLKVNITLSRNELPYEAYEDLMKIVCLEDLLDELPNGIDTSVGERGRILSGGQKQRISIARALIRQPELLILDDCLSAVDTETEEVILNRLKKLEKPTTTIISSHRISSIQHADEIIFLDSGKISERGTHEDLLKLKGAYYKLYLKQLAES